MLAGLVIGSFAWASVPKHVWASVLKNDFIHVQAADWWIGALIGLGVGWILANILIAVARKTFPQSGGRSAKPAPVPPKEQTSRSEAKPARREAIAKPGRSEAITLLSALQREARFVDFVQESLAGYTDAQIGAVARDVHRDCGAVLARMFALRPAVAEEEGKEVNVPAGFDSGRWRLTGNVGGEPPFHGRLVHSGWEAATCELPTWSGTAGAARIVAPAEVELR